MKLKSTTKHRRLKSRLLISMLSLALRFSYLMISKDSVFDALTYNLWSTTDYTITENVDYQSWMTGNNNQATKVIQTILRLQFDFNGYYDGKYYAIFTAWPSNSYYTIVSSVNCQISYYSPVTNAYEITFNGVQHCEIVVQVTNMTTSALGDVPPVFPRLDYTNSFFTGLTKICSSPEYLVERINSKLNDLKNNTDGIEGALSTIANSIVSTNTNLVTINSTLIDMYNRQNVTNGKLDTITTKLGDILDAIDDIDLNVDNNIETTIDYYNDQQVAINNIINNYIQNSHVGSQLYQGFLRDEVSHAYNSATNFASTIRSVFNLQGIDKSLNFFIEDYFMVMTRALILIALLG